MFFDFFTTKLCDEVTSAQAHIFKEESMVFASHKNGFCTFA